MRRSRFIPAVLVGAVVLGASGCGGSSPKPAPISESSLSASPTPSGAPSMPAEAKGTDAAAKSAMVRYYVSVMGYSASAGDVSVLRTLSEPGCDSCSAVISKIKKIYASGGHIEGRGYEISDARDEAAAVDGDPVVRVQLVEYPQLTYASGAAAPVKTDRVDVVARFRLAKSESGWLVRQWTRAS
jgi:hypothetical protein